VMGLAAKSAADAGVAKPIAASAAGTNQNFLIINSPFRRLRSVRSDRPKVVFMDSGHNFR